MASDSTAICNLALTRIGEQTVSDISSPTTTVETKCGLIYTQAQEELNASGPLLGWKFAKRRKRLDREVFTITAFASASSTTTTVTATHTLDAGDIVLIDGTTNYDDEYEVISVTGTTSFVITATYVAETASATTLAYWTSDDVEYRYSIPTSLRIVTAKVGGVELTDWEREGTHVLTNLADEDVDFRYIQAITTTTLFPPHFTKVLVLDIAIGLVYALNQDLKAVEHLEFDRDKAYNKAIALDEREKYVQESSNSWQDAGNITDTLE